MNKNSLLASVVLALLLVGLLGFYLLRDRTRGSAVSASPQGTARRPTTSAVAKDAAAPADLLQSGAPDGASTRQDEQQPPSTQVASEVNREEVAPVSKGAQDGSPSKSLTTDELAKKYERMNTEDLRRTFDALVLLFNDQRANMSADEIEAMEVEMAWVKAKGNQP